MYSRRLFLVAAAPLALAVTALAADRVDAVNHDRNGTAIEGYDPVAYFTAAAPVKGQADITYSWNGAVWRFASAGNRDLFAQDPEKYAPQYGGYCSYAVSEGHTARIDPQAWRIVNGKLYLNYSKKVQQTWEQDRDRRIQAADGNWPTLHR